MSLHKMSTVLTNALSQFLFSVQFEVIHVCQFDEFLIIFNLYPNIVCVRVVLRVYNFPGISLRIFSKFIDHARSDPTMIGKIVAFVFHSFLISILTSLYF